MFVQRRKKFINNSEFMNYILLSNQIFQAAGNYPFKRKTKILRHTELNYLEEYEAGPAIHGDIYSSNLLE